MVKKTRAATAVICAVAALALVTIATGVTYAATRAVPKTITACVHHVGGGLYKAATCAAHDSSLTWNIAGPQGAPGLSLFVRADLTGKIYEHSAGVTVKHISTGMYAVTFPQNVSKCAEVAGQGVEPGGSFPGGVFYLAENQRDIAGGTNVHVVDVTSYRVSNSSVTVVDAGFNLIVAC
jgi:hypothetical protein